MELDEAAVTTARTVVAGRLVFDLLASVSSKIFNKIRICELVVTYLAAVFTFVYQKIRGRLIGAAVAAC